MGVNMGMHVGVGLTQCPCAPRAQPARTARTRHLKPVRGSSKDDVRAPQPGDRSTAKRGGLAELGPIGMTFGNADKQASNDTHDQSGQSEERQGGAAESSSNGGNGSSGRSGGFAELGPIALSFAEDGNDRFGSGDDAAGPSGEAPRSISSMTTEQWRVQFEGDGAVDLWVEEEFNSGSRLVGGRDTHRGLQPGFGSGEGPSGGAAPRHTITIHNPAAGQEVEVEVPEDRYILHEAEERGLLLPWACRMGCCTACAVKVVSGEVHQPQALGISAGLREQGYALMCTSFPRSSAVLQCVEETASPSRKLLFQLEALYFPRSGAVLQRVEEDELYDKQFGEAFAANALDPNDRRNVLRDDYALEIADMDE